MPSDIGSGQPDEAGAPASATQASWEARLLELSSLIALLRECDLDELVIEWHTGTLAVRTEAAVWGPAAVLTPPSPAVIEGPPEGVRVLTSPLHGIFYRAPSPDAAPYAEEGDLVDIGDVLGLIEAMKAFTPIAAEFSGRVLRILAQNEQELRPGEAIMWLEPL